MKPPPKQPPLPNCVSSINSGTAIFHLMARFAIFFFTISLLHCLVTSDVPPDEKQALLNFITKVPHITKYSWDEKKPVCSEKDGHWNGVECDSGNNFVIRLKLPGASLIGQIPPETIGKLKSLRVLSLRINGLTGPLPEDLSNLVGLTQLHLNNNSFSGQLPEYFSNFVDLKKLVLYNNKFSGPLPEGFSNLKQLTLLVLSNNSFSGPLPNMNSDILEELDVSNNSFKGPIPTSLSKFPLSNFSRNINLCGDPLPPCKNERFSPPPPPAEPQAEEAPEKKSKEKGVIVGVSVGSALLLLMLLCLVKKKINKQSEQPPELPVQKAASASIAGTSTEVERNNLVFLDAGIYSFDLEDLYGASPEILGKGSFGTSYKVVLDGGTTVVVKRLKDVVVTKKDFESKMEVLGKTKNQHLIPLKAFYYSKDEKLLIYDYLPGGSLSARLHGSKGSGRTLLDWGHRMRIGLSAARGVAYLHEVGKLVHGDIKSSNILLQHEDNKYAFVCDFGLNTLFGPNHQVPGYLAPEVLEDQKLTFESDVYSFGVLLLELLTGKAPNHALVGGDLPRWVQNNTNIQEEWKADVFDVELMRFQNVELEMVELLKIAKECVSTMPNQRPSMHEVVRKIEDMNQSEFDDTSVEPSKGSDSLTPSTDNHSIHPS